MTGVFDESRAEIGDGDLIATDFNDRLRRIVWDGSRGRTAWVPPDGKDRRDSLPRHFCGTPRFLDHPLAVDRESVDRESVDRESVDRESVEHESVEHESVEHESVEHDLARSYRIIERGSDCP